MPSSYDEVAGMYHALWADWYLPAALPALEKLFFSQVPAGARVLDLCCGSGHVTRELVKRGYRVTGIDSSSALIELAWRELPEADLYVRDARALNLDVEFDAVLSTFDSLNHILHLDELRQVFTGVHALLAKEGLLVFDMNLEDAYSLDLREWSVQAEAEQVGLVRGSYDPVAKLATTELIWFVRRSDGLWSRHKSSVEQRCYSQQEILLTLAEAGFSRIEAVAARQAGVRADVAFGRVFFLARA